MLRAAVLKADRIGPPKITARKNRSLQLSRIAVGAALIALSSRGAVAAAAVNSSVILARARSPAVLAQAMVPPTGADDAEKPMPMNERMNRRFPQPVLVRDLIGLPVLDDRASTIGHVREVVRTAPDKIELVIGCGGWFGWGRRLVAVPVEVLGIEGRQLVSLDMPRSDYATAPTWQPSSGQPLPDSASIRVALARN